MEISNEKLASLNNISEENYVSMSQEFRHHTHTLLTMKKQLDSCFRRIRSLKSKLATQYPEAYQGEVGTSWRGIHTYRLSLIQLLLQSASWKSMMKIDDVNFLETGNLKPLISFYCSIMSFWLLIWWGYTFLTMDISAVYLLTREKRKWSEMAIGSLKYNACCIIWRSGEQTNAVISYCSIKLYLWWSVIVVWICHVMLPSDSPSSREASVTLSTWVPVLCVCAECLPSSDWMLWRPSSTDPPGEPLDCSGYQSLLPAPASQQIKFSVQQPLPELPHNARILSHSKWYAY